MKTVLNSWSLLSVLTLGLVMASSAQADVGDAAIRKVVQLGMKTFGREAAEIGTEALTRRLGSLTGRFGDDALKAFSRVGPKVSRLVDDAADPALAVKLLSRHGDDAVRIVAKPQQLMLVSRWGDDCAEALLKHGDAVEPVLTALGPKAATALKGLSSQNARRLSMMFADGELAKLGHTDELLAACQQWGNAAVEFVWFRRKELATGVLLTSFLANPEAFLEAGTDLTGIVADAAVKPVVSSVAQTFPWTVLLVLVAAASTVAVWIWRVPRTAQSIVLRALAKGAGRIVFPKKG